MEHPVHVHICHTSVQLNDSLSSCSSFFVLCFPFQRVPTIFFDENEHKNENKADINADMMSDIMAKMGKKKEALFALEAEKVKKRFIIKLSLIMMQGVGVKMLFY